MTGSWNLPARIFHWIMALMIGMMLIFGTIMSNTTDIVTQFEMVQQHKSVGFTVFVLGLLRVIWRLTYRAPGLPEEMPGWQKTASHVSHLALYGLIIAIPLSGWLMVTSSPLNDPGAYPVQIPNMVFGLFEMPDLFATGDKALSDTFHTVHIVLTKALMALLLLHVAAALKHQFVDRDGLLMRMVRG